MKQLINCHSDWHLIFVLELSIPISRRLFHCNLLLTSLLVALSSVICRNVLWFSNGVVTGLLFNIWQCFYRVLSSGLSSFAHHYVWLHLHLTQFNSAYSFKNFLWDESAHLIGPRLLSMSPDTINRNYDNTVKATTSLQITAPQYNQHFSWLSQGKSAGENKFLLGSCFAPVCVTHSWSGKCCCKRGVRKLVG